MVIWRDQQNGKDYIMLTEKISEDSMQRKRKEQILLLTLVKLKGQWKLYENKKLSLNVQIPGKTKTNKAEFRKKKKYRIWIVI